MRPSPEITPDTIRAKIKRIIWSHADTDHIPDTCPLIHAITTYRTEEIISVFILMRLLELEYHIEIRDKLEIDAETTFEDLIQVTYEATLTKDALSV